MATVGTMIIRPRQGRQKHLRIDVEFYNQSSGDTRVVHAGVLRPLPDISKGDWNKFCDVFISTIVHAAQRHFVV